MCRRRTKSGLRPQHLAGLRLIADISAGALQGGQENSSAIVLQPGRLQCRNALGDTGTAGSCALLAQVLHLAATTFLLELYGLPSALCFQAAIGQQACLCKQCTLICISSYSIYYAGCTSLLAVCCAGCAVG